MLFYSSLIVFFSLLTKYQTCKPELVLKRTSILSTLILKIWCALYFMLRCKVDCKKCHLTLQSNYNRFVFSSEFFLVTCYWMSSLGTKNKSFFLLTKFIRKRWFADHLWVLFIMYQRTSNNQNLCEQQIKLLNKIRGNKLVKICYAKKHVLQIWLINKKLIR